MAMHGWPWLALGESSMAMAGTGRKLIENPLDVGTWGVVWSKNPFKQASSHYALHQNHLDNFQHDHAACFESLHWRIYISRAKGNESLGISYIVSLSQICYIYICKSYL